MRDFFRLLSYGRPFSWFWIKYIPTVICATVFGTLNFTLVIPLLKILFGVEQTLINPHFPEFSLNIQYFLDLFNYFFGLFLSQYGKIGALQFICVVIVLSVLLANVARFLMSHTINGLRSRVMRNLRRDLFKKLTTLQMDFYRTHKKGDIISTASNDINEVQSSVVASIQVIFQEPTLLITYIVILLYISPQLTLFTLLVLPVAGFIIIRLAKKLRKDTQESQILLGRLIGFMDEVIVGARIVKAFNAIKYVNNLFQKDNDRQSRTYRRINSRIAAASPLSEFLGVSAVGVIVLYGGSMVLDGGMDASVFLTYIIIFSQILIPAKNISNAVTSIQRGMVSGERVFAILDEPVTIKDHDKAIDIQFQHEVKLENVTFSYQVDKIVENISLTIPKGKMYAFVGHSGSGKTTLINLIQRFYEVTDGAIYIDGVNIKDIKLESLYQQMGVVTQEAILFNDTVYNNIAFGMNVSEEQVIEAAKVANAHQFIKEMEQGYQTNVGDAGGRLSGGQKQRIAIARAVLKNPPLLILDEATSALDTESEKLVQEAIYKLMQNRTSIVIAHRLSTIQNADKIIVINQGKIVETGTHDELLQNQDGIYNHLCTLQQFK